jgi:superfamily II DNA/RNA helicase
MCDLLLLLLLLLLFSQANEDVTQVVHVVNDDNEKWQWLMERLKSFVAEGSVLIFGSTKQSCEELSDKLVKAGFHGTLSFTFQKTTASFNHNLKLFAYI